MASAAICTPARSVAALPATISFWIVGAMAALIAAAFVVNAYRRRYYGGLLVAPAIAVLFIMNIFPLLWSLGLSFFAYQSNQQTIRFVGLANYIKVLTNDLAAPANWNALINTAMFVVLTVSAQMLVGFLLAMLFAKQFLQALLDLESRRAVHNANGRIPPLPREFTGPHLTIHLTFEYER